MTPNLPPNPPGRRDVAVRVIAGMLTAVLGLPLLVMLSAVLSTLWRIDYHGYVAYGGVLFGVPLAAAVTAIAPLTFPRRLRSRAYRVAIAAWLCSVATLIAVVVVNS